MGNISELGGKMYAKINGSLDPATTEILSKWLILNNSVKNCTADRGFRQYELSTIYEDPSLYELLLGELSSLPVTFIIINRKINRYQKYFLITPKQNP